MQDAIPATPMASVGGGATAAAACGVGPTAVSVAGDARWPANIPGRTSMPASARAHTSGRAKLGVGKIADGVEVVLGVEAGGIESGAGFFEALFIPPTPPATSSTPPPLDLRQAAASLGDLRGIIHLREPRGIIC